MFTGHEYGRVSSLSHMHANWPELTSSCSPTLVSSIGQSLRCFHHFFTIFVFVKRRLRQKTEVVMTVLQHHTFRCGHVNRYVAYEVSPCRNNRSGHACRVLFVMPDCQTSVVFYTDWPAVWNILPPSPCNSSLSPNTLRRQLKTYLFRQ